MIKVFIFTLLVIVASVSVCVLVGFDNLISLVVLGGLYVVFSYSSIKMAY